VNEALSLLSRHHANGTLDAHGYRARRDGILDGLVKPHVLGALVDDAETETLPLSLHGTGEDGRRPAPSTRGPILGWGFLLPLVAVLVLSLAILLEEAGP
jgi:hypothetical protein